MTTTNTKENIDPEDEENTPPSKADAGSHSEPTIAELVELHRKNLPGTFEEARLQVTKWSQSADQQYMRVGTHILTVELEARFYRYGYGSKADYAVGLELSYLSKIEREIEPPPSEQTILRIAEALKEDPDVLLAGKVSADLREIICKRPQLFSSLLRQLKSMPDHKSPSTGSGHSTRFNPFGNPYPNISNQSLWPAMSKRSASNGGERGTELRTLLERFLLDCIIRELVGIPLFIRVGLFSMCQGLRLASA